MPYADVQALVNDIASFYDDVDVTSFAMPASKQRRYVHYVQLGVYEIWNFRPWYFKMANRTATFTAGESAVARTFANVGPNGALFDSQGRRWVEISYQDMVRLRAIGAGSDKKSHVFCVGTLVTGPTPPGTPGLGGLSVAHERGLIIPDNNTAEVFTLFYETSPPKISTTDLTQIIPLPESFHEPLLFASVSKLQEAKGDPRDIWKNQYVAQLAKLAEIHYPLASRMNQMPMTVGRGMW